MPCLRAMSGPSGGRHATPLTAKRVASTHLTIASGWNLLLKYEHGCQTPFARLRQVQPRGRGENEKYSENRIMPDQECPRMLIQVGGEQIKAII